MKWNTDDYSEPNYIKTKDDDFIEFLLVIKRLCLRNEISETQKVKK